MQLYKLYCCLFFASLHLCSAEVHSQNADLPVSAFSFSPQTQLLSGGYFHARSKVNLEKRLLSIDLESLLKPYQQRPGEQPWAGEHIGKFLHAAVLEYVHSNNSKLKQRMDFAAKQLMAAQLPDGYLGTYTLKERWTSWDVWCHKYNLIGLLSYFDLTKDAAALKSCEKMAALLIKVFITDGKDIIESGTHVGMAPTSILEPMVQLYSVTKKKEYLKFCNHLIQSWEQANGPKILSGLLTHGNVFKTANNKAYEMLSNLTGLVDLYKATGNNDYLKAVQNAWNDIVKFRLYIHGTTSHTEHFTDDFQLEPSGYYAYGPKYCGPGEGCVTVTWLQINMRLLQITGDTKYMQQIENTVYNAVIPSQNPHNGEVCYFLPLKGRKRFGEVNQGIRPDISCCASSIPRAIAMLPQLIAGRVNDRPLVLLLNAAKIKTWFTQNGKSIPVQLKIETDFPASGTATATVTSSARKIGNAGLLFYVPEWADTFTITINNEKYTGSKGSLLEIKRSWNNGDVLQVQIAMNIKQVSDNNKGSQLIALKRGPQLLAADENVSYIKKLPEWGWIGRQLYRVTAVKDSMETELLFVPLADAGQTMADYNVLQSRFVIRSTGESASLLKYRQQLAAFKKEFRIREMPDVEFFFFGMGNRVKLLYKNGELKNAVTGALLYKWPVKQHFITPNDYKVEIETLTDVSVTIYENEQGVYLKEGAKTTLIQGTQSPVALPDFREHKYSEILKVLHQELLINIVEGKPLPNFLVYNKPWHRDAAMMAMCFQKTGNLSLIKDWVLGLTEVYDRNNAGISEADNLGQTLYLLSLFTNKHHPLVQTVLQEAKKFEVKDKHGIYIKGSSDFHDAPVYQTKWMKFGLQALGMEDPYIIPDVYDDYSSLFWWYFTDVYHKGTVDACEVIKNDNYPYLGWAADNFHNKKRNPVSNRLYPLTWEQEASQAKYEKLSVLDNRFVESKISSPHSWHAAEVFLYLLNRQMK